MRSIPIVWNHLARRPGVAVLVILFGAGLGQADRFPPDPVEELRQTLKAPAPSRNLMPRVQALRTLADMRRALGLQEWRFAATATDEQARAVLVDRFKNETRRLLKDGTADIRLAVTDMLAEMGSSLRDRDDPKGIARALAPDLANLVKSGDTPRLREHAARALGLVFPDPHVAVRPLLDLLASPNLAERRAAVYALVDLLRVGNQLSSSEKVGEGVKADRGDIVQLGTAILPLAGIGFTNPDPEVRRLTAEATEQAAVALANQVPSSRPFGDEPVDLEAERQSLASTRSELLPLMEAFRQQEAVLAKALHDNDVQVRLLIQRALEELGYARMRLYAPATPNPAPGNAPEPGAAGSAARTSGELLAVTNRVQATPPPDPLLQTLRATLPNLKKEIGDPDVRVRLGAVDALEAFGPAGAPAIPALVRALKDPDRFVRWAAARTLGKVGPVEPAATVPGLTGLLFDPDLDVRLAASVALDRYGPGAKSAVPDLIRATRASDAEMRIAAMRTLEGIGTDAQPAIPALAAALSDSDSRVRLSAAGVLARFGPLAASAEPALRRAADDSDSEVRKAASDALLNILQAEK